MAGISQSAAVPSLRNRSSQDGYMIRSGYDKVLRWLYDKVLRWLYDKGSELLLLSSEIVHNY